jgi:OOP family OmpA-OmpF porin
MRNILTHTPAAVAVALALGIFSACASAQMRDPNEKALLLDTRGMAVMSSDLCWHTGYGPAPAWTEGCHALPVAQRVAPVAAAPAPAAPAAAVALPACEKVAVDADVLFDSGSSALRPAGRDALDAFVRSIHGLESRTVVLVGYADRMGTETDNQMLSEERVSAVKGYLVGNGIAASRIQSSAWGETRPGMPSAACADTNTVKDVACLQPERHVSVEITGSRLVQ